MNDRYRLQGLKDDVLVAILPKLVARENQHAADLLAHLAELDARRLYEDMGFHSLWEYCIEALGMCQTTAWRRYTAARVCRRFPAMFEAVARGEMQISVLAELKGYLDEANAEELLALCRRKSFRKVQQLLAARFPNADVTDSIRRTPERTQPAQSQPSAVPPLTETVPLDREIALPLASVPTSLTSPPTSAPMPTHPSYPPPRAAHRQVVPLSQDRFAVRFTADAEFLMLLEEVRGLSAHRDPSGDLLALLKAGLQAHHAELLKQRFAVVRKPRKGSGAAKSEAAPDAEAVGSPSSTGEGSRRHIAAEVARAVYERDCGQCTFVSATGRRCTARRQLELDHIVPWAVSRDDSMSNLRLRCRAHNQLHARRYFGKAYMRAVAQRVAARGRPERS